MRPQGQWGISVNGSTSVLQADSGGSNPPFSTTPAQGGVNVRGDSVIWTIVGILAIVALVIFIL